VVLRDDNAAAGTGRADKRERNLKNVRVSEAAVSAHDLWQSLTGVKEAALVTERPCGKSKQI